MDSDEIQHLKGSAREITENFRKRSEDIVNNFIITKNQIISEAFNTENERKLQVAREKLKSM